MFTNTVQTNEVSMIGRPIAFPMREVLPWAAFGAVFMVLAIYFVGVEPNSYVHEYVHDARHVLGFPCH